MKDYRKIYESSYGTIPVDSDRRTFEIHHVDGNHYNNDPTNLIAITIQEHYDIHYNQGDFGACTLIAKRMEMSPLEISQLASLNNRTKLENGTHNFKTPGFSKSVQEKRVKDGTHSFLKKQDGTSVGKETNDRRRKEGTLKGNPELGRQSMAGQLEMGTHSSQYKWTCKECGRFGQGKGNYTRLHGLNCSNKKLTGWKNTSKPCTVDGVEIFKSRKELISKLGWGDSGIRNKQFRYL